jgi:PmbA protein
MDDTKAFLVDLAKRLRALGADDADLVHTKARAAEASVRGGVLEEAVFSESAHLSVRVIVGKRAAVVTTNDMSRLDSLIERVLAMVKVVPEDPYLRRAETLAPCDQALPFDDHFEPIDRLEAHARALEAEACAHKGIVACEEAGASCASQVGTLVTASGFVGQAQGSVYSAGVSLLAGDDNGLQRDAYGHSSLKFDDLESMTSIADKAASRVLRRLKPRMAPTGRYPVFFESLLAPQLVGYFLSAINGTQVAEGMTFLRDALGKTIFAPAIQIKDQPHTPYTFGAALFDGEGTLTQPQALVEHGVLKTWLLNRRAAGRLGFEPTGHATWPMGGAPGIAAHHVVLEAGSASPEALMKEAGTGFWVTELLGSTGVNPVTGDFSMGASGLWIEDGQIAYPVHQATVAGRLQDMFKGLTPASDLHIRGSVNAPTLRVNEMTVSGS